MSIGLQINIQKEKMSNTDTLTIRGNVVEEGNLIIGAAIEVNGSFGSPGMAIVSAGPTQNAYWGLPNVNPALPNLSIQYNSNGVFAGDANLTWIPTNAT